MFLSSKSSPNQAKSRPWTDSLRVSGRGKRKRWLWAGGRLINFELRIVRYNIWEAEMEKRLRIKPKLSFNPGKGVEGVYRVRLGRRAGNFAQGEIWEAFQGARGASLTPRKGKPVVGLFRGARRIQASETYLLEGKTHRQSHTKESSSPQGSQGNEYPRLARPLGMSRNNRSMSGGKLATPRGKAIQRTVSIVIEGARAGGEDQREFLDTLSRIILGEDAKEDFLIEFLGESSIHGEELNFVDLDSRLLTEEVTPDQSIIEI